MNDTCNEPSDESLLRDLRAGNGDAFVQLVRRYKGRVFGLAARFARDADDLDDICQEVFIKVYENISSFRGDSPLEHWLSRITIRTCYDALRKRRREKGNIPLDSTHDLVEDASSRRDAAVEEARDLLEMGLSRLRPEERLVITLLELEEKTVKEAAELTGWSEANIKVRAFRARQKLKKILEN